MVDEKIKDLIYEVRGKKVILVSDLAELLGYKNGTKVLNKVIKRNVDKFTDDIYFQLLNKEFEDLQFQIGTAKVDFSKVRTSPFVLTLDGINVLSTILKSKEKLNVINETKKYMIKEIPSNNLVITNTDFSQNNGEKLENLIHEIRGQQVMLDYDLAIIYECTNGTKSINQAVKRNPQKFPNGFVFRLTESEYETLRWSQIGTASRYRNFQKLPYAFTEQGVAMLATVLNTPVADEVSVKIMIAFVNARHFIGEFLNLGSSYKNIIDKINFQEQKNLLFD